MAIRSGKQHPESSSEQRALQLINEEFTSSNKISKEAKKIAEQRQFHNENVEIEADRQADPESRKEDRRLDLVGYGSAILVAAVLAAGPAKDGAVKVWDKVTGHNSGVSQKFDGKPELKPLATGETDPSNITITADTLRNLPSQVETTVKPGETASEIAHRGFPQAPTGSALEQAEIDVVSGGDGQVQAGETVTVPKVPDYIQPNNGGETAHVDLNPNK